LSPSRTAARDPRCTEKRAFNAQPGRPAADAGLVDDDRLDAAGEAAALRGAPQSALDEVEGGAADEGDDDDLAHGISDVR
jgi:hypothetical protein